VMFRLSRLLTVIAAFFVALSLVSADYADARRGGSFGSRGTRTFQTVPPTRTAPRPNAPVERSMTPRPAPAPGGIARQEQISRSPGFWNGMGGSLLRGLALGGLIGLLLGHGFGGMAGMFGFLLQALLIGGGIMLLMRFLRSQQQRAPAHAPAGNSYNSSGYRDVQQRENEGFPMLGGSGPSAERAPPMLQSQAVDLEQTDLDTFERLLAELQMAFGREDHAALRRVATPEMISYLSEELAENAKNGVRNDVSDVKLLQADIAESWREGEDDYATAAFLYSSRDVARDRTTGTIVDGSMRPRRSPSCGLSFGRQARIGRFPPSRSIRKRERRLRTRSAGGLSVLVVLGPLCR